MPPHIKHAKLLKQAIDDKANVIEMDDKPDEDGELRDEGQYVVPDFGLEVDPDESSWCGEEGEPATATGTGIGGGDSRASETGALTVGDICEAPIVNGLEAFATAACPAPAIAVSPARQPRTMETTAARKVKATTVTPSVTKPPAARGYQPGSRDEQEVQRYRTMVNWSNRLGGTSLYSFRDADAQKRGRGESDADQLEASYAKAKRNRALKATTALKERFSDIENSSKTMGGNIIGMMMLLREESERKTDIRREEEEQHRRDAIQAREERFMAKRAEAEERRRQDRLDMEERARRDREESRARTQELLLLIGALTKKT